MIHRFPVPARRELVTAAALAAAVLAATAVVVGLHVGAVVAIDPGTAVGVVLAAAAWSWHRVAPAASAVVVVVVVCGYVVAGRPFGPVLVLVVLACAGVARHRPARVAAGVCAAAGVALMAALWTRLDAADPVATASILLAWPAVFVAVPGLAGALGRVRAQAAARERAALLARGADEERLRVAREVHDIAGHGFAVVAVQAGVALAVLDDDPVQARASMEAARAAGERALDELQALLDADAAPGAADVPALVDGIGAGGLQVGLAVTGDPDRLVPEVSTTVYRLVQEALTNVLRHAGPTTAEVALAYGPDDVAVVVRDRGRGATRGAGRGLRGLRERVERLHGCFTAADHGAGGFEVSATLPNRGAAP